MPNFSAEFILSKKKYQQEIENRTIALNNVKDYAKGTKVYREYKKAESFTKNAKKQYFESKKEESFSGFNSLQLFMGEFGKMFCFFVYALFNLSRSFYFERKNTGMKVLHGLIISGTIFYFFWMFQQFQDFSKFTYYAMTLISAAVVVHAVLLFTKYREHRINKLKRKQLELSKFTFLNTKPEKKKEMLEILRDSKEE